jgi:hypothetical protein
MPLDLDGTLGVNLIQDGAVSSSAKLADTVVTAQKLSGGQAGDAPVFGCRAWCRFNGTTTGTNAPLAGGNVTSVQRHGTGDYTITFTVPLPDALYAFSGTTRQNAGSGQGSISLTSGNTPVAGSVRISTINVGGGAADSDIVTFMAFR